jgi:hypothetical protein
VIGERRLDEPIFAGDVGDHPRSGRKTAVLLRKTRSLAKLVAMKADDDSFAGRSSKRLQTEGRLLILRLLVFFAR